MPFLSLLVLLFLVSCVSVLLLLPTPTIATGATESCESKTTSFGNNHYLLRGTVTVPPGKPLNDEARFPIVFLGDWNKVLITPEVTSIANNANDGVVYSEGPLVRKITNDNNNNNNEHPSEAATEVVYLSDTVRAVIYRISKRKNDNNDDDHNTRYNFEVWATQAGGINPDRSQYHNIAEAGSNGMATDLLDPEFVVINQHGLRRVIRCRLDDHTQGAPLNECPDLQVITDSFPSSASTTTMSNNNNNNNNDNKPPRLRFNSPNDVVVHPHDGSIWFTDPTYGLLEKDRFCDEFHCGTGESYLDGKSDIGWQGVYRVDREQQQQQDNAFVVELVTKYHRRPNGLGFTPDAKQLWVADSTIGNPSWTAYDIATNNQGRTTPNGGSTSKKASDVLNPATLGAILGRTDDLPPLTGGEGLSDGFKFDEQGYLWTSIPNGFAVIDTAKREVICQILLGVNTSNLAFGTNGDVWLTGKSGVWKITRKIE